MSNILVVVDMQKDFVDGALGTKEAVEIVDYVAEKMDQFDGEIYVTYDTHTVDYLNTQEGKYLPVEHCIKGTPGWELNEKIEAVAAKKNAIRVEKITFGSVDLPKLVKEQITDDTTITLVGLCTDICVVSNALLLKANYPETDICVDAKGCAGVTPQAHDAALTTMRSCQIRVEE